MSIRYRVKFYWHAILFSGIFIGLIAISWFLFTLILESGFRVKSLKRDIALLKLKTSQTDVITLEYSNITNDVALLNASLLQNGARLPFIMLVERLAMENSISHVIGSTEYPKIKGEEIKIQEYIYPITFNINVNGKFSDVLRFIYLLENEQYNIKFLSIQLNESGDTMRASSQESGLSMSKNNVKAQLQVLVYAF